MAVILWVSIGLSLLMQGCLCTVGQTIEGCLKWTPDGNNVCCEACHPGHRMVRYCGPNPKDLCTPCESNTFTTKPKDYKCTRCTQCVGAQVQLKECTATSDTKCGCKEGLTCGDDRCSYCYEKCDKGYEPTERRSCRPCPDGTFNDQINQKCKPWSTKCPNPDQKIVAMGNALTDIKCANVSVDTVSSPKQPEQAWPLVLSVVTSVVVMAISIIVIIVVTMKIRQKRKKTKKTVTKPPIISTPTDDPRTLIAIECSFHEAQQEQGSSSESLASKDSSEQLIG